MGYTFEEQQEARNAYQAKVRDAKRGGKPININPTHTTPNPTVDNVTTGETHESRKDETTADEIIETGETMGTYGKPAVQLEEGEKNEVRGVTAQEDAGAEEEVQSGDEDPVTSAEAGGESAPERPAQSDKKADWVAYVAALTGETEEDIDQKHTKDELVTKYGG